MRSFLVVCTMLCVVCWRIYSWIEWRQRAPSQISQLTIWNSEPIQRNTFNCLLNYRGIQIQVKLKECTSVLFRYDGVGAVYDLSGSWRMGEFSATSIVHDRDTWLTWFYRLNQSFVALYQRLFPEPESSLMAGFVLGAKGQFSPAMTRVIQQTGTMHIMAASGYNVSLIIGLCLPILVRLFGRRWGINLMAVLLMMYVLLVGLSPSIIRAGIMGCLVLLSQWSGKRYWAVWGLGVTAWILLCLSPWLIESVSFQLSFAATVGIMIGRIPISIPNKLPPFIRNEVVDSLMSTVYAWVMTAPIVLWHFQSVSWWAIIANPLLLWMVPLLTYLGFIMLGLGIVWFPLAQALYWAVEPILKLFVWWMSWLGSGSWGTVAGSLSIAIVIGWYMVWVGIWLQKDKP